MTKQEIKQLRHEYMFHNGSDHRAATDPNVIALCDFAIRAGDAMKVAVRTAYPETTRKQTSPDDFDYEPTGNGVVFGDSMSALSALAREYEGEKP